MNKNLAVIQKVSQVAKVVCRVLFICSIVGAAIGLAAAITAAIFGTGELFRVGKTAVFGFIVEGTMTTGEAVMVSIALIIMLIPSAILMKFAENYFELELKEGTPFTVEGAERIKKLGLMTIIMPTAAEIIVQTMAAIASGATNAEITSGGSIITGLLLFFLHFVFKYGAEISDPRAAAAAVTVPVENKEN